MNGVILNYLQFYLFTAGRVEELNSGNFLSHSFRADTGLFLLMDQLMVNQKVKERVSLSLKRSSENFGIVQTLRWG